jgi:hypothetical protein
MTDTTPAERPRPWRSNPAEAAKANGSRRRSRAARKKVVDHLTARGLVRTARIVWVSPPSLLPEFMTALDISPDILGDLPMPGTGPAPAPAAAAIAAARAELDALAEAHAASRTRVAEHLTSLGLTETANVLAASPPAILAEFIIEFDINPTVLGDLPIPAPEAGASAALAVRTAWREVSRHRAADVVDPRTGVSTATMAAAQDSAHRAKGRQALIHTRRPVASRPPARPLQPEATSRPPSVDPEAMSRLAAAFARATAASKPDGKPNCSVGNLEVITKWETLAEEVCAAEGTVAQCRAANTEAQMLCAGCPLIEMCGREAKANHYTGVAGGRIFVYGRPRLTPSTADRIVA